VKSLTEDVIPELDTPPKLEETIPAPLERVDESLEREDDEATLAALVLSPPLFPPSLVTPPVVPPLLVLLLSASVIVGLETSLLVEEIPGTSSDDALSGLEIKVELAFSLRLSLCGQF